MGRRTQSLFDVVLAVEGDPASTVCLPPGGPCRWEDFCAVHVPWSQAQQAPLRELRGALEGGTYEPTADAARTVASAE